MNKRFPAHTYLRYQNNILNVNTLWLNITLYNTHEHRNFQNHIFLGVIKEYENGRLKMKNKLKECTCRSDPYRKNSCP